MSETFPYLAEPDMRGDGVPLPRWSVFYLDVEEPVATDLTKTEAKAYEALLNSAYNAGRASHARLVAAAREVTTGRDKNGFAVTPSVSIEHLRSALAEETTTAPEKQREE